MKELFKLNLSNEELKDILEINPEIKEMENEEIKELINLLKNVGCEERHITNIIYANPFYFSRSYEDIKALILKLYQLGLTHIYTIFDSNPFLLNKDSDEIDKFIEIKQKEGLSLEEIIDIIDSDSYQIDEI